MEYYQNNCVSEKIIPSEKTSCSLGLVGLKILRIKCFDFLT